MTIRIRSTQVHDASLIMVFITELAVYEKASKQVATTVDSIVASLFGDNSPARAPICEVDGEVVGYAIYFYSYSIWLAKKRLYLEDFYISPAYRGNGAGKRLLQHLAGIAMA